MAVRPPQIRYLTEGKAIGASIHKGWAATWNWVLSCVNFFKAGNGLKLSDRSSGRPRLDVLIESGAGISVTCAGDGHPYVIEADGSVGGNGGGSMFHFAFSHSETTTNGQTTQNYSIGEGAVQIGGYTYFSAGSSLGVDISSGTYYVCAKVALASGTVTFETYSSTSGLNSAQGNHAYYIFPLYKTVDGAVVLDYRPIPNAGCWEIAESVQSGGIQV